MTSDLSLSTSFQYPPHLFEEPYAQTESVPVWVYDPEKNVDYGFFDSPEVIKASKSPVVTIEEYQPFSMGTKMRMVIYPLALLVTYIVPRYFIDADMPSSYLLLLGFVTWIIELLIYNYTQPQEFVPATTQRPDSEHGDARFATPAEMRAAERRHDPSANLRFN